MRKEYDLSKAKKGAVNTSSGKTRITIMLDDDRPVTVAVLRKVLREELQQQGPEIRREATPP